MSFLCEADEEDFTLGLPLIWLRALPMLSSSCCSVPAVDPFLERPFLGAFLPPLTVLPPSDPMGSFSLLGSPSMWHFPSFAAATSHRVPWQLFCVVGKSVFPRHRQRGLETGRRGALLVGVPGDKPWGRT